MKTIKQKLEEFMSKQNDDRPLESKVGAIEFLLSECEKLEKMLNKVKVISGTS